MSERKAPGTQDVVTSEAQDPPEREPSADEATTSLIELLLSPSEAAAEEPASLPERIGGVVVGRVVAASAGSVVVAWAGAPAGAAARTMLALDASSVGREAALMFEGGDRERPMVVGLMEPLVPSPPPEVTADDARVVVSAGRELVLRCGDASITLTRAGKILIRGAYVSSHATTVQRIRGGTVEIN